MIIEDSGKEAPSGDQEFLGEGQEPQMEMSVEYVRAKFTIKTNPMIIGEPTYQAINELREALYVNAADILTTIGGGRNCNAGLIMDAAVYDNILVTTYTISTEPGPYATHRASDTAAERADTNKIHKEERQIYNIDENLDDVLKQELIATVEETYLTAKKQRYMGFHTFKTKDPMDDLMERYGKIWAYDLEACRLALEETIEVDHPSDFYF